MNLKKLKAEIRYRVNRLKFIKALFSPFKPFKLRWYFGETQIGTPYFFPRKWVKATPKLAHKAALEHIQSEENYNRLNPKYARTIKSYDEIYQEKLKCSFAVPKKIGFDFVGLGWKTKWTDTDYRFEWSPVISFVFFGYQIAATVVVPKSSHYWEAWLYYENDTDKTKSALERIEQCKKDFPLIYKVSQYGKEETIVNYYETILRKKYLK
jgi:hypothetical protein